ncbi:MAG: fumarylacetoacetate hydrolase family protein [Bradyrhizobium sp.]|nr:fumarylacetoacetate hydrolase family protein [Bradyrhizobium sp.]
MRLASYVHKGRPTFGVVVGDGVFNLESRTGCGSLRELLARGDLPDFGKLGKQPDGFLGRVELLPPIPDPPHFYCIGVNYADHLAEVQKAGITRVAAAYPPVFMRYPESYVAHDQRLVMPGVSERFDYEAELAVVIGKGGRHIDPATALEHVAGYTIFNDGSIRDWQFHTQQVGPGKNFFATGALGPWIVTPDEIGDANSLKIELRLNGRTLQSGNTRDLIFGIPQLISYISEFMPLVPGDLIATGTPAGVGFSRKPPIFMKAGDICEIEIQGIGTLRNVVAAEPKREHWAAQ